MFFAAFTSACSACPQTPHTNTACERRFVAAVNPHTLHARDVKA